MKACILAIGSEMLTPFRVDTNSLKITERLNAIGYGFTVQGVVVADDVERACGGGGERADSVRHLIS